MYRSLKEIKGYKVGATDGEIGNVADFFFESWTVRYLVIETGGFFSSKPVLISPRSFKDRPDWTAKIFPVDLTIEQVKAAPDIDTAKPFYRQKESEFNKYYRLTDYWIPPESQPQPTMSGPGQIDENGTELGIQDENSSIRSFKEVAGYHVHANDGSIGSVVDFIIDDEAWVIRLFVVDIGSWLSGRKVVLCPLWAERINWYTRSVQFDMSKEQIKDAPDYDPDSVVDRKYEEALCDYYKR